MGINEQSAAATLARLGIRLPGLPQEAPVVSQSVLEQSPSLGIGAKDMGGPQSYGEHTDTIDNARAVDTMRNAPGVAQHQAIMDRNAESMRAGFPGGYGQQSGYERQQAEREREIKMDIAREQTQAEMGRLQANQAFQHNEGDLNRQATAANAQATRDAANARDAQGLPGGDMYKAYAAAKANEQGYSPTSMINRWRGQRDPMVLEALKPILDRKGQLQELTGMAGQLKGMPGATLADKARAYMQQDPNTPQEALANPLAGMDEYQIDYLTRVLGL